MAKKQLIITGSDSGIDQLKKIINGIKSRGNTGHSYSIILDPDDESPGQYGWDGDGSDRIDKIEDKIDKAEEMITRIRNGAIPTELLQEAEVTKKDILNLTVILDLVSDKELQGTIRKLLKQNT